MKICMIQSYSKNNQKLFNLTIGNHLKYCNLHEYSFWGKNESYKIFFDIKECKNILKEYDLIFSVGSDVLITNLNKKIEDFLDAKYNIALCKQGHAFTYVNGQILCFWNNQKTFEILDYLDKIQDKNKNIFQGTQGIFNKLYYEKNQIYKNIQLIEAGKIQKYKYTDRQLLSRRQYQEYLIKTNSYLMNREQIQPIDDLLWTSKQDFLLHTLGGTNDEKYLILLDIIKKYPELSQLF